MPDLRGEVGPPPEGGLVIKPGRYATDQTGRTVYVVDVQADPSGNRAADVVKCKLAGPYGAAVTYTRSMLSPAADPEWGPSGATRRK